MEQASLLSHGVVLAGFTGSLLLVLSLFLLRQLLVPAGVG